MRGVSSGWPSRTTGAETPSPGLVSRRSSSRAGGSRRWASSTAERRAALGRGDPPAARAGARRGARSSRRRARRRSPAARRRAGPPPCAGGWPPRPPGSPRRRGCGAASAPAGSCPAPISPVITTRPPSWVMPNRMRARPSRWSARSKAKRVSGSSRKGGSASPQWARWAGRPAGESVDMRDPQRSRSGATATGRVYPGPASPRGVPARGLQGAQARRRRATARARSAARTPAAAAMPASSTWSDDHPRTGRRGRERREQESGHQPERVERDGAGARQAPAPPRRDRAQARGPERDGGATIAGGGGRWRASRGTVVRLSDANKCSAMHAATPAPQRPLHGNVLLVCRARRPGGGKPLGWGGECVVTWGDVG